MVLAYIQNVFLWSKQCIIVLCWENSIWFVSDAKNYVCFLRFLDLTFQRTSYLTEALPVLTALNPGVIEVVHDDHMGKVDCKLISTAMIEIDHNNYIISIWSFYMYLVQIS